MSFFTPLKTTKTAFHSLSSLQKKNFKGSEGHGTCSLCPGHQGQDVPCPLRSGPDGLGGTVTSTREHGAFDRLREELGLHAGARGGGVHRP